MSTQLFSLKKKKKTFVVWNFVVVDYLKCLDLVDRLNLLVDNPHSAANNQKVQKKIIQFYMSNSKRKNKRNMLRYLFSTPLF
jgi:hypothetical protein